MEQEKFQAEVFTRLNSVEQNQVALKTQTDEKWKAHDDKSDFMWTLIRKDLTDLGVGIANLIKHNRKQDDDRIIQKIECMKEVKEKMEDHKSYVKQLVAWVLGIPSGLGVVLALIVNWKKIFPIIFICLFLSGCASTLVITYDEFGKVMKIIGKGTQDSLIKQGDVEVKMNNKPDVKLIDINLSKVGT